MMKSKEVVAGDSENEFEVDEPEEVGDHSDDEWAPTAAAKTPGKRGRPAKSAPASKKKKPKVSDDEDEEEILPKKERGSKAKPPPPAPIPTSARGRGRATKVLKVEPEEELEDDEEDEDIEEDEEDEEAEDDEEDDDDDVEEEEEELNQGPNAKPAKKFTSGAFVVLKTDMIGKGNPPVWKIDGKALLQKYIPFKQDGKVLYKNTSVYSGWGSNVKEQYYSAPVSFIQQTRKEHIIEFYKDKIKKDPKVEEAAKKELEEEEAELGDDDDEKEEQDEA
ncbi:ABC transporter F family member 4-like [Metopolophium dirhodum]|uniref:ABC transporter F family member 4-like n=1 Tax=Metopolophium dirhodum TaxID=44670 RepID=UPI00298FE90E|nr:ABC transporter F family member 4-like [Metopolophium dirhodum]